MITSVYTSVIPDKQVLSYSTIIALLEKDLLSYHTFLFFLLLPLTMKFVTLAFLRLMKIVCLIQTGVLLHYAGMHFLAPMLNENNGGTDIS